MNKTQRICYVGVLTALYIVLSAFLKFNLIGNIQVDLGYIVFAYALCEFGIYGTIVGVIGCTLESILFSAYGFSVSWATANMIIGITCGLMFMIERKLWIRIIVTIIASAIGILFFKTLIECNLYSIPFAVKIPKNAVAFGVDATAMIIGLFMYDKFNKVINLK